MFDMNEAFILINCDLGSEFEVISNIKKLDGVTKVTGTFGAYDIIPHVENQTIEGLRELITWKIRKLPKIRSTLTLMVIEGQT